MANVYAVKNGNWSDTTLWNTSALPATIDDVFSNNFTVYVDNTYRVTSIQNISALGITAGGRFILNDTVTLSANVVGGGANQVACVQFLSAAPATATLVGNLCAVNTTFSGPRALIHNGTGTLTVIGNGLGRIKGTGNPADGYIQNQSTGTLNLFGTYFPGSQIVVDNRGIWNQVSGTINLVGTLSGGAGGEGLYNRETGTVNITGDVFGGPGGSGANVNGINGVGLGTVNILGNVFARVGAGVQNIGPTNIIGTVVASPNTGGSHGFIHQGTYTTATIYGNVSGSPGSSTAFGVVNNQAGTTIIYGNVHAINGSGARNTSSGTLIIYGNVFGGSSGSSHGVVNTTGATGIVFISGNVIGGTGSASGGLVSNGNNRSIVVGNVIGGTGSSSWGAINDASSYMEVQGIAIGNGWGLGSSGIGGAAVGIQGSQISTTIITNLSCGPRGQWPTAGNVFIIPQSTSTATLFTSALSAGPSIVLFTSLSDGIVPPVSSVRQGTVYNLGDYRGTCAMPSVSAVLEGISVDNSVGIAALQPQTIWNYSTLSATDVNSLGGRLKEVATVQSVGQQLTALN